MRGDDVLDLLNRPMSVLLYRTPYFHVKMRRHAPLTLNPVMAIVPDLIVSPAFAGAVKGNRIPEDAIILGLDAGLVLPAVEVGHCLYWIVCPFEGLDILDSSIVLNWN